MLKDGSRWSYRGALFGGAAIVLTLVLGMIVVPANSAQAAPASATVDGLVLEADSSTPDAGATVTGFTGDLGESVTIPEIVEIDGIDYVVTTIGEQALEGAPVSSVVIPDSVTTIRSRAFYRAQLTSLVLPESVTSLGTLVFGENPLASLHWPDNGLDVPDFTFSTNKLTKVVIPPSVRRIGASAFQNGQIKSVDLGNVEVIGQSAFSTNQITDLTIPESTSHILGMAFYANQIENLEFLTTGPLRIRGHVFARNQITKLVLPGTLELDRYSAFEDNKISDLTISEGMTSLHLTMFKNNRLTSVTIPASMSKLEAHVFVDNPDLTEIYFDGDAPAELFPASVAGEQDNESLPSKTATIFFHCFAKGFTTPLWQGYNTLPNPDTACSVDFDTLGGEPVPPKQELEYGGFATPPADTPVRAGSVFTGWYTSPEATDLFDFAGTEVTAPLTLYAGWRDSIPRTVSFDSHGGSAVAGVTVEHGEAVAKPTPDPVREGYEFTGWFVEAELTDAYDFAEPVVGDLVLHAKWVLTKYSVSFDSHGGSAVAGVTVEHGEAVAKPTPDPVREGYEFAGWFVDAELTDAYDFGVEVTADFTLHAKWVLTKYSVSFDSRGGSAVAGVTVEHGEAVAKPTPDPVREGYEFAGWFVDAELTDAYDFGVEVTADFTLHAKWEAETKPPVGPTEPQPPTEPGDEGETPGGGCPPGSGQKPGGVILPGEGPKPGGSNASAGGCTGAGIADSGAASPLAAVAGGLLALLAGAALVLARRRDVA